MKTYRWASPPARGGIRDAGGERPWAQDRERRALDLLDRLDPWLTRAGWIVVFLAGTWFTGAVALRLL